MSGGSLDYACYQILDASKAIRSYLDKEKFPERYPSDIYAKLSFIADHLRTASMYAHAVEWYFSCDYGDDTFREVIKNIESGKTERPARNVD